MITPAEITFEATRSMASSKLEEVFVFRCEHGSAAKMSS